MQQAHFCSQHSPKQKRGAKRVSDASALEALCSDLTTTTSINRALAQTFLLMAQGRISRKDAVAFGYLSQLLLQSVSGVRAEYVAANGYRQWEHKLKTCLEPITDEILSPPLAATRAHRAVEARTLSTHVMVLSSGKRACQSGRFCRIKKAREESLRTLRL